MQRQTPWEIPRRPQPGKGYAEVGLDRGKGAWRCDQEPGLLGSMLGSWDDLGQSHPQVGLELETWVKFPDSL